ncbi:MAG TPA: hypothetical protein VM580_33860, partial [Labilithrix sp.]|nr:hypothetical protein [Labilithrix sp.]
HCALILGRRWPRARGDGAASVLGLPAHEAELSLLASTPEGVVARGLDAQGSGRNVVIGPTGLGGGISPEIARSSEVSAPRSNGRA